MQWGKLYASLVDDPRVQAAEDNGGAGFLLFESICYLTSAETGGFIPHTQVSRFGGGSKKRQKVAALVREEVWLPVEGGYLLDPRLWSEERNLGDQAEKKREADRARIAAKRAAARPPREDRPHVNDLSRDSRATSRATPDATVPATCSGDSRGPEETREEQITDLVSHPPVAVARQADDDDGKLAAAVTRAVAERTGQVLTVAEALAVAARVLGRASSKGLTVHYPPRYVAAAVADEPDLSALLQPAEPPPAAAAQAAGRPPWPAHCGECDPRTRLIETTGPTTDGRASRCPRCHPSTQWAS